MKSETNKYLFINIIFILFLSLIQSNRAQQSYEFELEEITFIGNKNISSTLLEEAVVSKTSPGWFLKFVNSFTSFGESAIYYDKTLLQLDLEAIKELYWSRGYFKVNITNEVKLDSAALEATLIYKIDENYPFKYNSLNVNGVEEINEYVKDEFWSFFELDTSDVYSQMEIENLQNESLNFLKNNGYMLSEISNSEVKIDTNIYKVDVIFDFKLRNKYFIKEVRVNKKGIGQDLVDEELITDIVGIKEGDNYRIDNLRNAQVRLYRTNIFSSALVSGIVADTSGNFVPILVSADVGRLHEISPDLFFNNEDNSFNTGIGISFSKKNFLGGARKFTIGGSVAARDITKFLTNFSLSDTNFFGYADSRVKLEQPFLFGKAISSELESYITLQKRRNEYSATLVGGNLSFNFEMPKYTLFNGLKVFLNIETEKYFFFDSYIYDGIETYVTRNFPSLPDSVITSLTDEIFSGIKAENGNESKSTNTNLGIELSSNKTNDYLFPTRGFTLGLRFEDGNGLRSLYGLISGIDPLYYKTVASAAYYFPISDSKISAYGTKFRIGYIHAYRGNVLNVPINQRFYAGGSNSVRGWGQGDLAPEFTGIPTNLTAQEFETVFVRNLAAGGFFLIEGSLETRYRVFESIGVALFADYGNVWDNYDKVQFDQIAVAAGFGFRYYSQIVPFRVDFAVKAYDPSDRRSFFKKNFWDVFQFHLGIGEAF